MSCFIDKNKIDKYKRALRGKITATLLEKAKKGQPINVAEEMNSMYEFFKSNGASESLSRDAAAATADSIDKLITLVPEFSKIVKAVNPKIKSEVAGIIEDLEIDVDNIKNYITLADKKAEAIQKAQVAIKLSNAIAEEEVKAPVQGKFLRKSAYTPIGFSTSGLEIKVSKDEKGKTVYGKEDPTVTPYFDLKRRLLDLFSNAIDDASLDVTYPGIGKVFLKIVSGSTIPKEARSENEWHQSNLFDSSVVSLVVDEAGNTLFITPQGELVKQGNKIAYFQLADPSRAADSKKVTNEALEILRQTGKEATPENVEEVENELNLQVKEMAEIGKYIAQNPASNFVMARITGGNRGYMSKIYAPIRLSDIKTLNSQNLSLHKTEDKKGDYFVEPGTNIRHVLQAAKFSQSPFTVALAEKLAKLFANPIYITTTTGLKELSFDEKIKLLKQFSYPNQNTVDNLKKAGEVKLGEAVLRDTLLNLYQSISGTNLKSNTYTDFSFKDVDGKIVIETQNKSSYYEDFVSNRATQSASPVILQPSLTFAPAKTEIGKIYPQLAAKEAETIEESKKEAEVATPENILTEPSVETRNLAQETLDELFKTVGVKTRNKKESGTKIAKGLIWYLGGKAAKEQKAFKDFLETLSESEKKEILAIADATPNAHPMSSSIPFSVMFTAVNSERSGKVASWSTQGIVLYHYFRENGELDGEVSGDFSDIYHEAWHGFTQTFLTEKQRKELYKEASKMPGMFKDYQGNYVTFKDATPIQLEEYLAEDFREYMLSGGKTSKKEAPVRNTIFQKILGFLKDLFNNIKVKVSEVVSGKDYSTYPKIREYYENLSVGNMGGYKFDINNRDQTIGELQKTAEARSTTDYNLGYEDSQEALDTFDSLLSDVVDDANKNSKIEINGVMVSTSALTAVYLKKPENLKKAYTEIKNRLAKEIIPNLKKKLEQAVSNADKTAAEKDLRLAEWLLNNFGDVDNLDANKDGKGMIAYHQMKSRYIPYEDRKSFFEDINEEEKSKKGNKIDGKSGNEESQKETADPDVHALLRSLHDYKGNEVQYNRLGVKKLVNYDTIWNKLSGLLSGLITEDKILAELQEAAKTDGTLAHLLQKLGQGNFIRLAESRLWGKFWQTFNWTNIPLIQVTTVESKSTTKGGFVEFTEYFYKLTTGRASAPYQQIGRTWENTLRARTETTKYIKKDENKVSYIDIDTLIKDFGTESGSFDLGKKVEFLKALGLTFSEEVRKGKTAEQELRETAVGDAARLFNRLKSLSELNIKRVSTYKDLFREYSIKQDKVAKELGSIENLYVQLQELEFKYAPYVNNTALVDPNGNVRYEQSLNSTMTVYVDAINNAKSFDELWNLPYMSHLDPNKNSWVKSSVWINSLFNFDDGGKKRPGASLKLDNVAGVKIISGKDEEGDLSAEADEFTKFIQDFHLTVFSGSPELPRHADKTSSYSAYPSQIIRVGQAAADKKGKLYVNNQDFLSGAGEEIAYNQVIFNYISSEFERVKKFREIEERIKDGETIAFDLEYLKRGRNFLVFEKILGEEEIKALTKPENKNLTLIEIINKDTTGLGQRIKDQVQSYFKELIAENTAKFEKAGKFVSPTYLNAFRTASQSKLTDAQLKDALVKSFTYNNWINGVESMIVLYGDIAQYNLNKEEFHKRNAGIASTGKIFRWGSRTLSYINSMGNLYAKSKKLNEANYIDATGAYNTAILKDNTVGSKYVSDIREALESDIRKRLGSSLSEEQIQNATDKALGDYKDAMKEGDAQGWITFDAYRAFKISIAEWSENQELMYRKLVAGETLDPKKTLEFFPVMKLQQWGNLQNDYASAMAFHKFSLVPLIPSLTKDKKIESLHDKMMNENIAYAVFQSGSKVSTLSKLSYKDGEITSTPDLFYKDAKTREIVTTEDPAFTKNTVYLQSLKSQVDVHPEYKGESTFPSQMRKLIENGLVENGVPVTYKPEITDKNERVKAWEAEPDKKKNEEYNLILKYENSLNNMMDYLKEELIAEADIKFTGEGDDKKVIVNQRLLDFLVKELEKSGDLADHEIAVIKLGPNGTLAQDLSISMLSDKIEKALNNIVVRRLVKQKFNGEPLIQVSTAGFEPAVLRGRLTAEEEELYGTNDLPFYTREKLKDGTYGKTNAGKVKISLQGKFVNLLVDDDVLALASQPEIIAEAAQKQLSPELVALNKLIKTEEWLNKGDNRKMVTIRGPRIPTQEHNSMEFLEVYEFLDPKAGNIVILPSEIVAKSGGDFDVDKITFLFSNIELIGNKPAFVKANNSIKKSEIASTKKQLKDKLESLYKRRNEIDEKYQDDFDLMKETKAFNELTDQEKKVLTDRKKEFKEQKIEANLDLNKLYGLRSNYIKSLKRDYDSEVYDNLQKVEDQIITQNDLISRIDKQSKALTSQYKSVFKSEKVKAFWDAKNQEIADINSEIDSAKGQLLSISRAAFENDVMDSMDRILENRNLYLSLVRPNSIDVLEPIAKSIADKILEKDYNEISYTDKGKTKKRIAGSSIFEYGYNLYKHQSNNIGKKILGIFAVSNTYNSIFNRIGLKLKNQYLYGEKRDIGKKRPTAFTKRVHLALKHNTLKDENGNEVISLSHLTDANNQYYISSLISQLINGSVDVAKDAWLFLIQGNYEVGPTLEFLIETGVPVEQAIYYVSQPLVREYVAEMQKARSSFARPMGEVNVEKKAFARNYAVRKMLDKYFPGLYQEYEIGKNGMPYNRPYNSIQNDIYNETLRATSTKEFNDFVNGPDAVKNLKDNITSTKVTDIDKAVFLHFLEMEEMKDAVKVVKMATNFDTTKSNSVYEADSKIAIAEDLKSVGMLPDNILDSILKNTPIGSFYVQPFQIQIFKDMFSLNNNPVLVNYINNLIKDPRNKPFLSKHFDKTEDFIKAFKNALPSFILQNELRSFDINAVSYKGTKINTGTGIATIQPVLSLSQGITVVKKENGERVIYIDRAQLKQDFTNIAKIGGVPQYKDGKILSVPAKVNPGAFIESPEAFYKFVMERELLRSMYTIDQLAERKDFQDRYKNNLSNAKTEGESDSIFKNRMRVLTYEELLRDIALDNSLNHWKMFKSEDSYANQFNKILSDYPELSRYSIIKNLTYNEKQNNTQKPAKEEKNGSTKNLVFANSFVDTDTLNIYHENILELSDPSKIQITASEVEKKRVAEFFDRMPLFAFMQSGKNSTSSLSIIRAMPQDRYIRLMVPAAARFINNINTTTLNRFMLEFGKNTENYQTKNRGEDYTILNYNPEKDKAEAGKLPETGPIESIELEADELGNYTISLTGKETEKQALATIEANPNAVFIVEDSEKPAANKIGQAAFVKAGKNVLVVKTKPTATTVYTDVTEDQAKQIKKEEENTLVGTDDYLYYGKKYTIVLQNNKGVSVVGYKGKTADEQKLLDYYNTNPNLDIQKTKQTGKDVYWRTPVTGQTAVETEEQEKPSITFADGTVIETPFVLNKEQEVALLEMENFYSSPEKYDNQITLLGYAGTGKTSIISIFDKYLQSKYDTPVYSSPTHRANAVTKLKNPKAKVYTLHSLFGLQGQIDLEGGDYSLEDLKFAKKSDGKIKYGDTLIVDEASMVSDALYDFLEEGKEVLNLKIIYVGDPAQLKPVKSKGLSKALEKGTKLQLTKVERTGDNPILEESTNLRNGQDLNYKTKMVGNEGVVYGNTTAFYSQIIAENFKNEEFKKNKLYFRVLSATNDQVSEVNERTRELIFGEQSSKQLLPGDILMGYNNFDIDYKTKQPKIINSGDYEVVSVEPGTKTISISGKPVTFTGYNTVIKNILIDEGTTSIFVVDNSEDNSKIEAFAAEIARLNIEGASLVKAGESKMAVGYFQAAREMESSLAFMKQVTDSKGKLRVKKTLDYGYAHTIHKSQGGTYNKVLILADTINRFKEEDVKQQLKYVAVSRAQKQVYIYTSHTLGTPEIKEAPSAPVAQPTATVSSDKIVEGDIFALSGIPVITTNLGGVHGAGLAQAAKSKGLIKQGDGDFKASDEVVQLPVKLKWSDSMAMNNNMGLLNQSLSKLVDVAKDNPNNTYLLPLAGLGHGEGSVEQILPLLIKTLQASPNIKLVLPAEGVSLGRQGTVRKDYTRENLPKIKQMLSEAGLYATQPQAPTTTDKFAKKNIFTVTPQQGVSDNKAKAKASIATQYIGFGEGIVGKDGKRSSTQIYREQVGVFANTGNYSSNDVIFVSVPGLRGDEAIAKREQDKTIKEAIKAVEAGATILTDNKKYIDSSAYNTGEKKLYNAMQDKRYNYSEITVDGQTIGTWSKLQTPVEVIPAGKAKTTVNPKIKEETDALVSAINELRSQGKDIVYVKGGIGNDLVKSIPGKPAPATQSFIYLSEQLLKANILNPKLAKVVNDPQNETSESGKEIIQKVQKDIFGISDDDVSDNLLFCIADL